MQNGQNAAQPLADAAGFLLPPDLLVVHGRSALRFSFSSGVWTQLQQAPPPLSAHTAVVLANGTAILLFGAVQQSPPIPLTFSDGMHVWDVAKNVSRFVRFAQPAPAPRIRHASVLDDAAGTVWMWGGLTPHGPLHELWALDVRTSSWTLMPPPPETAQLPGPVGASMALIGTNDRRRILVCGGAHGPLSAGAVAFPTCLLFSTTSRSWTITTNSDMNASTLQPRALAGPMGSLGPLSALCFSGAANLTIPSQLPQNKSIAPAQAVADSWIVSVADADGSASISLKPLTSAISNDALVPSPRMQAVVASDGVGNVVIYGGRSATNAPPSDDRVYVYSGSSWISPLGFVPGTPPSSNVSPQSRPASTPTSNPDQTADADHANLLSTFVITAIVLAILVMIAAVLVLYFNPSKVESILASYKSKKRRSRPRSSVSNSSSLKLSSMSVADSLSAPPPSISSTESPFPTLSHPPIHPPHQYSPPQLTHAFSVLTDSLNRIRARNRSTAASILTPEADLPHIVLVSHDSDKQAPVVPASPSLSENSNQHRIAASSMHDSVPKKTILVSASDSVVKTDDLTLVDQNQTDSAVCDGLFVNEDAVAADKTSIPSRASSASPHQVPPPSIGTITKIDKHSSIANLFVWNPIEAAIRATLGERNNSGSSIDKQPDSVTESFNTPVSSLTSLSSSLLSTPTILSHRAVIAMMNDPVSRYTIPGSYGSPNFKTDFGSATIVGSSKSGSTQLETVVEDE